MRNISDKSHTENQTTYFGVIIFPRKSYPLWDNVENVVQLDRPQMKIWLMFFLCQITKATNTNTAFVIISIFYKMYIAQKRGQSFWLQIQRSLVRFPALPDFLSSSESGTGSTQPREVNWGATWIK
jgi:hypothetical protein